MNEITNQDWFRELIDDINSAKTQLVKDAREAAMKVAWLIGTRIVQDKENLEKGFGDGYVTYLAQNSEVSDSTIRHAIRFAQKFPDFEKVYELPEGENISLHKVIHKYLYDPSDKKVENCEVISCPNCGKKIKHKKTN